MPIIRQPKGWWQLAFLLPMLSVSACSDALCSLTITSFHTNLSIIIIRIQTAVASWSKQCRGKLYWVVVRGWPGRWLVAEDIGYNSCGQIHTKVDISWLPAIPESLKLLANHLNLMLPLKGVHVLAGLIASQTGVKLFNLQWKMEFYFAWCTDNEEIHLNGIVRFVQITSIIKIISGNCLHCDDMLI